MTTFPFRIREIPILGVEAFCQGPTPDMSPCVREAAQNWLLSLWGRSTGRLVGPRSLNTTLASPLVPQWGSLLQFPSLPSSSHALALFAFSSPLSSIQLKKTCMKQPLNTRNCAGPSHPGMTIMCVCCPGQALPFPLPAPNLVKL